jgi:hypothetical protein
MRPEERAATLKFYDILQERVKTYVEGAPQDLFYYHDKNSGSWEDLRRKAVCAFGVMIRKDYTTTQMLKQYTPPRKSVERYRPDGIPFTTLPWEATTFMHCYVIKDQSQLSVVLRIVSVGEKDYNPYWSTEKTEFDRVIYTKMGNEDIFDFRMEGKDLVDCFEQKALEIAEIFRKRLAAAIILYQELKRYAKNQQKLLERKKEIEDKYKAEMVDLKHTYGVYIDKMRRMVETQNAGLNFLMEIEDGSVSD